MVIPIDPPFESRTMVLKDEFKPGDLQWSERPARLQQRFLVLRKLGQGTYGKVQLALNKETNQEVAIKTIKKAKIENEEDMLRIRREIHIMTSIRHPFIIHINEVFETRQKIVLVMEYASGGELYDYLGCHHTLPELEARRLFRQIASAIYYCHKNKICHRDLKLENILLDEKGNAQIADFGLSNIFDDRRRMNTFCGSPLYASPEIVKGTPYKGPEVDCWSLGVLLYTLIYGTMPFDGRNFKELVSQISEGRYEEPIIKSSASNLIRRLLTPDILRRATIIDVCKDSWVNQGYDESLLISAEKMASEALLKARKLGSPKFLPEKNNAKNGTKQSIIQPISNKEKQKGLHPCLSNGDSQILSSVNNQVIQKAFLYEEILNYDVKFIMNKLLSAVESTFKCPKLEAATQSSVTPAKEIASSTTLKSWPKNGEHSLPTKVDSAYVIPIFEVTSVVPKIVEKKVKNLNKDTNSSQNPIVNGHTPLNLDLNQQKNIKINKLKNKKKENLNAVESTSLTAKFMNSDVSSNLQKELLSSNMSVMQNLKSNEISDRSLDIKRVNNQENNLSRNPSVKMKRALENQLFGQKHFGPFFRSKNHSLTLARIFSMKYEKLVRTSFKLPERKQKPPGKIVIPATFDPSIPHNDTQISSLNEKKQIVLFPTVSVSENKEKIEKKIDKIKKAALNMNLILRSNSQSRLKIQKYLKSQAKKIQDLVCDEQRSLNASREHINGCEGSTFPVFSDAYFSKFERGNLNAFNVKMHNKKINFAYANCDSSKNTSVFDVITRERRKFTGSGNLLMEDPSFGLFTLTKSKSDIQFPVHYANSSISDDIYSKLNCLENQPLSYFLSVPRNDFNPKLTRSASDSEGLSYYKNVSKHKAFEENHKVSEMVVNVPHIKTDKPLLGSPFHTHNDISERETASFSSETTSYLSLSENESNIEKCKEYLRSITLFNYNNEDKIFAHNSINPTKSTNFQINGNNTLHMQRSTSEYLLGNGTQDNKNVSESTNSIDVITNKTRPFSGIHSDIRNEHNKADANKKGLRRRNTFNCVPDYDNGIVYSEIQNIRGKSVDNCSDFDDCIRAFQSDQELQLGNQKDETKFSSSPNLHSFHVSRKMSYRRNIGNKVEDRFEMRDKLEDIRLNEDSLSPLPPPITKPSERSEFLKRILQGSDLDSPSYDFPSRRISRTKSISEDAFIYNGNEDLFTKTSSERKVSMQQGISHKKSPFLSKFLNELENREQLANTKNNDLGQRRYPRNIFTPGKRSKLEKRSKSFLQLLSLKRIQEAEKEIERVERDTRLDAEEEESAGSLLEALKTHGYKGVISQRFQGTETNSLDTYNLYNSTSPFLMRKFSPDFSRFNSMYYDNLPQLSAPTYEMSDLDMLNGLTLKSPFEMYPELRQNSSKQMIYDWLSTTNQNEEYSSAVRADQDSFLDIENISSLKENSNTGKENTKPVEDEASSAESFDTPKDPHMNGTQEIEQFKIREFGDYSTLPHYTRSERNQLRRTSSTSEDEKEESVQDRIWRKSFYSRFNNSALSRKERTAFIDTQFSPESRASFNGSFSPTSFKVTPRDGTDVIKLNGYRDLSLSRVPSVRKYSSPNGDVTPTDYARSKPPTLSKNISDEKTMNTSFETKSDETEPEH